MKALARIVCSSILVLSFCFLAGCGGSSSSGSSNQQNSAPPSIGSLSPAKISAGSGATSVTVSGSNFTNTTVIQIGLSQVPTSFVGSSQVTASLSASALADGGMFPVIALNGSQSSASSAAVSLEVDNPPPAITQIFPATELVGAGAATALVSGTGFVPSTTVNVNGSARTAAFVSDTQMDVELTAADLSAGGVLSLTAVNGTPGGGTSAAASLPVNFPVPTVASISPQFVLTTATAPVAVTVTGTNFVPASTVQLAGVPRATTYVSPTRLTFQLAAADLAAGAQTSRVTVTNPAPGGGSSLTGPSLSVLTPTPTPVISQVSPAQFIVGSAATSITVTGTNLFPTSGSLLTINPSVSTVLWNGTSLTTTGLQVGFAGQTEAITATVPANLLAATGTVTITVNCASASPSVSNALTATIGNPPAPTLTSISPNAGPVNTSASVTLTGAGFTSGSTVSLNGTTIPSQYVSAVQMTATIPAASTALPGNVNLSVTTPAPGGGTSASAPYTAYIPIANNSMVYNPVNGLFYVSVPGSAGAPYGNSVVSVDPATGALGTPIPVGSEPDRLAISADGNTLWVGLDGASAVRQVNLATGVAGIQFSLGGNKGVYATPPTVYALAALPGSPNSVIVAAGNTLAIYDAGVLRGTATGNTAYSLQVDGSKGEVYAAGYGGYTVYTYSASGLTQKATAYNGNYS